MKYLLLFLCSTCLTLRLGYTQELKELKGTPTAFKIIVTKHCMFGDFDLILHDYSYKRDLKLYFAVKHVDSDTELVFPILRSAFQDRTSSLSEAAQFESKASVRDLLANGYVFFLLPEHISLDGTYELRICSDSSDKPSCFSGKTVSDIPDLLKAYQDPPAQYVPSDHVYYGQMFLKRGSSTFILQEALNETNRAVLARAVSPAVSTLQDLERLRSLPLRIENGAFLIALPVLSPKKCGSVQ